MQLQYSIKLEKVQVNERSGVITKIYAKKEEALRIKGMKSCFDSRIWHFSRGLSVMMKKKETEGDHD